MHEIWNYGTEEGAYESILDSTLSININGENKRLICVIEWICEV